MSGRLKSMGLGRAYLFLSFASIFASLELLVFGELFSSERLLSVTGIQFLIKPFSSLLGSSSHILM